MTDQNRAERLRGVSERRGISEFELRDASNGNLHFTGYAAVWEAPYEVTDRFGTFTEVVARGALARTLGRNPDVVLNINHDGLPLARTTAGTLRLGADEHGFHVEADLEPRDPDVESVRYKLERGDLTDMSWAFRVIDDVWTEDDTHRMIREANIHGGDVSIVTTGANPATTANPLRMADAIALFTDPSALAECRSREDFDLEALKRLSVVVGEVLREEEPPARKTMSIAAAKRALLLD